MATKNSWINGQRDYYLYSFDNDPSTPETKCRYFKDADHGLEAYAALSNAQMLTPRELPDAALQRAFQKWAFFNSALSAWSAAIAIGCPLAFACPVTVVSGLADAAGCVLALYELSESTHDPFVSHCQCHSKKC